MSKLTIQLKLHKQDLLMIEKSASAEGISRDDLIILGAIRLAREFRALQGSAKERLDGCFKLMREQ